MFVVSLKATAGVCYEPQNEPELRNANFSPALIARIQPLLRNAHERYGLDPRLVYYRIIGESRGNPHATNPSSGAYGLFQFNGARDKTAAKTLCNGVSDDDCRYRQINYYLTEYVGRTAQWLSNGGKANCPAWGRMTNFQKVAILGWGGSCTTAETAERNHQRHPPASYRMSVFQSAESESLCSDWVHPQSRTAVAPGRSRNRSSAN